MYTSDQFVCRDLVELVTEYFEGTLAPEDRARFEMHLDDCPPCVTYVDQMRQTLRAIGRLDEEAVTPEAREALLSAFRDWRAQRGD